MAFFVCRIALVCKTCVKEKKLKIKRGKMFLGANY